MQTLLSLWLPIKSVVLKNIQTPGGNFTENPLRVLNAYYALRGGGGGGGVQLSKRLNFGGQF